MAWSAMLAFSPLAQTTESLVRKALHSPLEATDFKELGATYSGKVRDNCTSPDGRRFIVVTDRISAFYRILGTLPLKGHARCALR